MNVVHISANDGRGGAGLAGWRLHRSLQQRGVHSRMLVQRKYSADPSVDVVASFPSGGLATSQVELIQETFAVRNRTGISNTHFSIPLIDSDLSAEPAVAAADVIHLHWVASMQTPARLRQLLALNKPVVWTLHDFEPFTGGCHFPAGCLGFQGACTGCPQLQADPFGVPAAVLGDKLELITSSSLALISPSHWLADQASTSALFRSCRRIEVIPHGIDTQVFRPRPWREAREALGVPTEGTYLLFGSEQGEERRKGFATVIQILCEAVHDPRFVQAGARVLWVGNPPPDLVGSDLPVLQLGRIADEERMALAYAAADLFVLPSLEDNLPNMLLESLSCGTPVVASAVGGIPEVIRDGVNGRLVAVGDERGMSEAMLSLASDPELRRSMGEAARRLVCEEYSALLQATRHVQLYESVMQAPRRAATSQASQLGQSSPSPAAACSGPGPAVGALLHDLTIHSLTQDRHALQRQVQAFERERMAQARHIEVLQEALHARADDVAAWQERVQDVETRLRSSEVGAAARLEVIQGLQDHWQRAEAEAVARLRVIEELDAHRQWLESQVDQRTRVQTGWRPLSGVRRVASILKASVRWDHWWYSKIPPLLAVAYLQVLLTGLSPDQTLAFLPFVFLAIVCVASYGHVINDIFDVEPDRRAGKPNAMAQATGGRRILACVALVSFGFLPALIVDYSFWGSLLLLVNYLLPTIYSVPGIRLKERGLWGVLCDAAGSHIIPTAFVLTVGFQQLDNVPIDQTLFAVIAVAWSAVLGIKGILNHQVADRENDIAAGTVTFASSTPLERIERWLPRYNLCIELPVTAAFVFVVSAVCPLAVIGFLGYLIIELLKYRLGFRFALTPDARNTRASIPFVNDFFYELWLPMAAALQLAFLSIAWLWLPVLQVVFFKRTLLIEARDLRSLAVAVGGRFAHGYRLWRLKRGS